MAYLDLPVLHVGGLIRAYLGTACRSLVLQPAVLGPAQGQYPALTLYRKSAGMRQAAQLRLHEARLHVGYSLGPVPDHKTQDAWGSLLGVIALVDEALHRRSHPSYEDGDSLEKIAGIVAVELLTYDYGAALAEGREPGAHPAWEGEIRCVHGAAYDPAGLEAMTALVADYPEIERSPDPAHPGMAVRRTYETGP